MTTAVSPLPFARYGFPPSPVRRFSVDEYHQMIDEGFFARDERFELLEGWIVAKTPRNPIHDAAVAIAQQLLQQILPPGWHVRVQSAVTLADSEPEPDLAIVRGEPRDYVEHHPRPSDIALIVEVANTTLADDRDLKCRIYARGQVPSYWIINLIDRRVEAHSNPTGPIAEPAYRARTDCAIDEIVPVPIPAAQPVTIRVRDLLP